MKKRALSVLLALMLIVGIVPFSTVSVQASGATLADLQAKFPQCKTVLLHGSMPVNNQQMATRLANLKDRVFVTESFSTDV